MIIINITSKNPYWLEAANQLAIFKYGQGVELARDFMYQGQVVPAVRAGLELAGASSGYSNHLAVHIVLY